MISHRRHAQAPGAEFGSGSGVYDCDCRFRTGVPQPAALRSIDIDAFIAFNAYNATHARSTAMATLTVRNLEDSLKSRLRLRAAARNRSMEDEVRHILRAALQEPAAPAPDLGARIRARFAAFGDVQLPLGEREPVRPPPVLAAAAPGRPGRQRAAAAHARRVK
jgi:antitoxin FitA